MQEPSVQNPTKKFKLFACCILVKGANRSAIFDLQRGGLTLVPNDLAELLENQQSKSLEEILIAYNHEFDEIIQDHLKYLTEKELGFWFDEPEKFPPMPMDWHSPSIISNAIIDSKPKTNQPFEKIFRELEDLGCKSVQLRFFFALSLDGLKEILDKIYDSRIKTVEIVTGFVPDLSDDRLIEFMKVNLRVDRLIFHSAPVDRAFPTSFGMVIFSTHKVDSETHCGVVAPEYFAINTDLFTESMHFNNCLNKKISVDSEGNIKNCPSMRESYGKIETHSLHSALTKQRFTELWEVNKDQIEVCKDCEFRYICTDCRAYIQDPDKRLSKPSKCNYDPYTSTWK